MNIFSLYIYDELHASSVEVGLVLTMGGIASALLMLPVGYLADRVGKKKVIVTGCYITSLAQLLLSLTRSWMEVIPILFLLNAGFSYRPAMTALTADSVVKRKRATGFAFFQTLPQATMIFAAGLGGFLAEPTVWGFRPIIHTCSRALFYYGGYETRVSERA